jgi:hypothetical protein
LKYFAKLADFDVASLNAELDAQPELWDAYKLRTTRAFPFGGTHDIWLRHRSPAEVVANPPSLNEPHFAEFWPSWRCLPSAHAIVFHLMALTRATGLGAVLITHIPPGGEVQPHSDKGFWNAEAYPLKVYVVLKGNEQCVNYCGNESVVMREGEAITFDNRVMHSVVNDGDTDRVTLIVCMRQS